MTKVGASVHFLNFLYDHKDYPIFDNTFSIIMNSFPETIGLETNSSLQDGNKPENSDCERVALNLKKDRAEIAKNLSFPNNFIYTFQ